MFLRPGECMMARACKYASDRDVLFRRRERLSEHARMLPHNFPATDRGGSSLKLFLYKGACAREVASTTVL